MIHIKRFMMGIVILAFFCAFILGFTVAIDWFIANYESLGILLLKGLYGFGALLIPFFIYALGYDVLNTDKKTD